MFLTSRLKVSDQQLIFLEIYYMFQSWQLKKKNKPSTGWKVGYFVITCDEAYQSKLKKEEESKRDREKKKLNAEKAKN